MTNASLYSLWRIFIQHHNMCGVGFRTGSVKSGVPSPIRECWTGVMQDREYELPRMPLPRTRVNKPFHTSKYLLARLRLMYMSTVRLEAPRQVVLARRTSSLRLTGTLKSLFCRVEG